MTPPASRSLEEDSDEQNIDPIFSPSWAQTRRSNGLSTPLISSSNRKRQSKSPSKSGYTARAAKVLHRMGLADVGEQEFPSVSSNKLSSEHMAFATHFDAQSIPNGDGSVDNQDDDIHTKDRIALLPTRRARDLSRLRDTSLNGSNSLLSEHKSHTKESSPFTQLHRTPLAPQTKNRNQSPEAREMGYDSGSSRSAKKSLFSSMQSPLKEYASSPLARQVPSGSSVDLNWLDEQEMPRAPFSDLSDEDDFRQHISFEDGRSFVQTPLADDVEHDDTLTQHSSSGHDHHNGERSESDILSEHVTVDVNETGKWYDEQEMQEGGPEDDSSPWTEPAAGDSLDSRPSDRSSRQRFSKILDHGVDNRSRAHDSPIHSFVGHSHKLPRAEYTAETEFAYDLPSDRDEGEVQESDRLSNSGDVLHDSSSKFLERDLRSAPSEKSISVLYPDRIQTGQDEESVSSNEQSLLEESTGDHQDEESTGQISTQRSLPDSGDDREVSGAIGSEGNSAQMDEEDEYEDLALHQSSPRVYTQMENAHHRVSDEEDSVESPGRWETKSDNIATQKASRQKSSEATKHLGQRSSEVATESEESEKIGSEGSDADDYQDKGLSAEDGFEDDELSEDDGNVLQSGSEEEQYEDHIEAGEESLEQLHGDSGLLDDYSDHTREMHNDYDEYFHKSLISSGVHEHSNQNDFQDEDRELPNERSVIHALEAKGHIEPRSQFGSSITGISHTPFPSSLSTTEEIRRDSSNSAPHLSAYERSSVDHHDSVRKDTDINLDRSERRIEDSTTSPSKKQIDTYVHQSEQSKASISSRMSSVSRRSRISDVVASPRSLRSELLSKRATTSGTSAERSASPHGNTTMPSFLQRIASLSPKKHDFRPSTTSTSQTGSISNATYEAPSMSTPKRTTSHISFQQSHEYRERSSLRRANAFHDAPNHNQSPESIKRYVGTVIENEKVSSPIPNTEMNPLENVLHSSPEDVDEDYNPWNEEERMKPQHSMQQTPSPPVASHDSLYFRSTTPQVQGRPHRDVSTVAVQTSSPVQKEPHAEIGPSITIHSEAIVSEGAAESNTTANTSMLVADLFRHRTAMLSTRPSMVEVCSLNREAAARAAAILKKHHKYIQYGTFETDLEDDTWRDTFLVDHTNQITPSRSHVAHEKTLEDIMLEKEEELNSDSHTLALQTTPVFATPSVPGAFPPKSHGKLRGLHLPRQKAEEKLTHSAGLAVDLTCFSNHDWASLDNLIQAEIISHAKDIHSNDVTDKADALLRAALVLNKEAIVGAFLELRRVNVSSVMLDKTQWSSDHMFRRTTVLTRRFLRRLQQRHPSLAIDSQDLESVIDSSRPTTPRRVLEDDSGVIHTKEHVPFQMVVESTPVPVGGIKGHRPNPAPTQDTSSCFTAQSLYPPLPPGTRARHDKKKATQLDQSGAETSASFSATNLALKGLGYLSSLWNQSLPEMHQKKDPHHVTSRNSNESRVRSRDEMAEVAGSRSANFGLSIPSYSPVRRSFEGRLAESNAQTSHLNAFGLCGATNTGLASMSSLPERSTVSHSPVKRIVTGSTSYIHPTALSMLSPNTHQQARSKVAQFRDSRASRRWRSPKPLRSANTSSYSFGRTESSLLSTTGDSTHRRPTFRNF